MKAPLRNAPRRHARSTRLSLTLALCALTTMLIACAPPRASTLTILSSMPEQTSRAVSEAFQRETGIRTLFVRIPSNEGVHRLTIERGKPFFSVWWGADLAELLDAAGGGWLEPYTPSTPLPPAFRDADGLWTAVYLDPLAFASNRKQLAARGLQPPVSWAAALDASEQDMRVLPDPATAEAGYALLCASLQLGPDEPRAMQRVRSAASGFLASGRIATAKVAAGEASLSIAYSSEIRAVQVGAPDLAITYPVEGTVYALRGAALVRGAKQPAEARQFLDWMLGPTAQRASLAGQSPFVSVFAPQNEPADAVASPRLMDVSPTNAIAARAGRVARFRALTGS